MKELFVGEVALKVTISLAVCSHSFCLRQPLLVQLKFIDWQEVRRLRMQWGTGPFLTIIFVTGCTKAFSQLSNLQSHSRCHQTDKPYKCNSCYKCFADEQSLFDHIPKHKESKHIKTHICSYCGKSYTQVCNIVTRIACSVFTDGDQKWVKIVSTTWQRMWIKPSLFRNFLRQRGPS